MFFLLFWIFTVAFSFEDGSVEGRNVKYTFIKAITQFYSRIVLTKLNHNQTVLLRKLEKEIKSNIKANADIQLATKTIIISLFGKLYNKTSLVYKLYIILAMPYQA